MAFADDVSAKQRHAERAMPFAVRAPLMPERERARMLTRKARKGDGSRSASAMALRYTRQQEIRAEQRSCARRRLMRAR